ncbi:hypothetical protein Droror1_Dr00008367, partial [Drosera rotundifolia]
MDVKLLFQTHRLSAFQPHNNRLRNDAKLNRTVWLRPFSKIMVTINTVKASGTDPSPSVYHDTWLDRLAINHFSNVIQDLAGIKVKQQGYDGLVEASRTVYQNLDAIQQREFSLKTLNEAFPPQIVYLIRATGAPIILSKQVFAKIGSFSFGWLVGPSEVRESELRGRREKNVMYLKKCRFLESSNCIGMCINQCKFPTQTFLKESLGMPVNMIPNYEDMSCEIRFGEEPPASDDDPVSKQPCYKL